MCVVLCCHNMFDHVDENNRAHHRLSVRIHNTPLAVALEPIPAKALPPSAAVGLLVHVADQQLLPFRDVCTPHKTHTRNT